MKSEAKSVDAYLKEVPEKRKPALEKVAAALFRAPTQLYGKYGL